MLGGEWGVDSDLSDLDEVPIEGDGANGSGSKRHDKSEKSQCPTSKTRRGQTWSVIRSLVWTFGGGLSLELLLTLVMVSAC